ncbi:MAG: hypothetical protein M0P31_18480 [Solirubrobacteraceae bacterium]|nr:hypothetical protein [Solirubrobacteraceae bacterium]
MSAAERPVGDGDGRSDGAATSGGRSGAPVRRLTDADARGGRLARRLRPAGDGDDAPEAIRPSRPLWENVAVLVAAMAGGTLVAELAGAANLGTALSFGQIAFAIALVVILVRR